MNKSQNACHSRSDISCLYSFVTGGETKNKRGRTWFSFTVYKYETKWQSSLQQPISRLFVMCLRWLIFYLASVGKSVLNSALCLLICVVIFSWLCVDVLLVLKMNACHASFDFNLLHSDGWISTKILYLKLDVYIVFTVCLWKKCSIVFNVHLQTIYIYIYIYKLFHIIQWNKSALFTYLIPPLKGKLTKPLSN